MEKIGLKIEGMSCTHCVGRVERALAAVAGVSEVSVTLEPGAATVTGDGVSLDDLVEAVDRVGYTATFS